jgi:hypothetical protein
MKVAQSSMRFNKSSTLPGQLYTDMGLNKKIATASVLQTLTANYKAILVGDASMAPEELLDPGGAIYYYHNNDMPVSGYAVSRRISALASGSTLCPNSIGIILALSSFVRSFQCTSSCLKGSTAG